MHFIRDHVVRRIAAATNPALKMTSDTGIGIEHGTEPVAMRLWIVRYPLTYKQLVPGLLHLRSCHSVESRRHNAGDQSNHGCQASTNDRRSPPTHGEHSHGRSPEKEQSESKGANTDRRDTFTVPLRNPRSKRDPINPSIAIYLFVSSRNRVTSLGPVPVSSCLKKT